MKVQFYHLTQSTYERALPGLLNKALAAEIKTVVKVGDKSAQNKLDKWLWEYDPNSFLPHGSRDDEHAELQPVLLTTELTDLDAEAVMVTDGTIIKPTKTLARLFDLFDGNNEQSVSDARMRWKHYKDAGYELAYWQQQPGGGWKQAA
jgi:DNA polymerase-3 subunit chi